MPQPQIVFLLVMLFGVQCLGMLTLYSYRLHIMCYKSYQMPKLRKLFKMANLRYKLILYEKLRVVCEFICRKWN